MGWQDRWIDWRMDRWIEASVEAAVSYNQLVRPAGGGSPRTCVLWSSSDHEPAQSIPVRLSWAAALTARTANIGTGQPVNLCKWTWTGNRVWTSPWRPRCRRPGPRLVSKRSGSRRRRPAAAAVRPAPGRVKLGPAVKLSQRSSVLTIPRSYKTGCNQFH